MLLEMLTMLKAEFDIEDSKDVLAQGYINSAMYDFLNARYPTQNYPTVNDEPIIEKRFESIIYDIAVARWAKRGAEQQIGHSENSISRQYGDSDPAIPILRKVTPVCGVVR
jgi:hypothetical protein